MWVTESLSLSLPPCPRSRPGPVLAEVTDTCKVSDLNVSAAETKELTVDFRKKVVRWLQTTTVSVHRSGIGERLTKSFCCCANVMLKRKHFIALSLNLSGLLPLV